MRLLELLACTHVSNSKKFYMYIFVSDQGRGRGREREREREREGEGAGEGEGEGGKGRRTGKEERDLWGVREIHIVKSR